MLTAWDKTRELSLALPDYDREQLASIRERARSGVLVCPTCQQPLWLRAGDVRIPHFGHRTLNDCPQGRVSEAVLAARHYLYRFFRVRIEAGKLAGEVELEPRLPGLDPKAGIDLLLHRAERAWVAVGIVETSLKPEIRQALKLALRQKKWIFRAAFLHSRLKPVPDQPEEVLLDTTEREFRIRSVYDLDAPRSASGRGTLHFIDTASQSWTTLRSLYLVHDPQVFHAAIRRHSSFDDLLWSEAHSEWAHPGEAEALKAVLDAQAAEAKRHAEEQERLRRLLAGSTATCTSRPPPSTLPSSTALPPAPVRSDSGVPPEGVEQDKADEDEIEKTAEEFGSKKAFRQQTLARQEEVPGWLATGLVCVGCGRMVPTIEWQNASPGNGTCVCRTCFAKGVRLL